MSSQERKEGENHSEPQEQEPSPYRRVARFASAILAHRCDQALRRLITEAETDISIFRFQFNRAPHVAAVADLAPGPELRRRIDLALGGGEVVSLHPKVLELLLDRRRRATALRLSQSQPPDDHDHEPGR